MITIGAPVWLTMARALAYMCFSLAFAQDVCFEGYVMDSVRLTCGSPPMRLLPTRSRKQK